MDLTTVDLPEAEPPATIIKNGFFIYSSYQLKISSLGNSSRFNNTNISFKLLKDPNILPFESLNSYKT